MQYSLEQIDEAIYYYLTLNQNTLKTTDQIYLGLIDENICPELKHKYDENLFRSICEDLNTKFDSIVKTMQDQTIFLKFIEKPVFKTIEDELFYYCEKSDLATCEIILSDPNNIIDYDYKSDGKTFYDVLAHNDIGFSICKKLILNKSNIKVNELRNSNAKFRDLYIEQKIANQKLAKANSCNRLLYMFMGLSIGLLSNLY